MWAYVRLYRNLQLADTLPVEFENVSIDILIGNDYYLDLILPERMEIQKDFTYLLLDLGGFSLDGPKDLIMETRRTL